MEKQIFSAADLIMVPTEGMVAGMSEQYGIAKTNFRVVPTFVDTKLFSPNPSLPKRQGQLLFVGELTERKNFDLLFDAVAQVEKARLMIIGDGPLRPKLEKRIRAENLNVDILGNRPYRDLPSYINSCEAFIITSLYESQPSPLLEAMSCGACVIGAVTPGIRDLIADRKNGMLVESCPDAFARTIKRCLTDPQLSTKLGKEARNTVRQTHSLVKSLETEKTIYMEMAEKGYLSDIDSDMPLKNLATGR